MKRNIHAIDDQLRRWGGILIALSLLGGTCVGVPLAMSDGYRVVTREEDGSLRERKIYSRLETLKREHPDAVSIEPLGADERLPVGGVVGVAPPWSTAWLSREAESAAFASHRSDPRIGTRVPWGGA